MIVLLRYHAALLLRSQRWLPPFLLYCAALAVGVQAGQPVLDSLGYTSAAVLPVAAWLVRVCAVAEPPAARDCVAAAVGPARAHLARVLTALGAAAVLGTGGVLVVAWVSDPHAADHQVAVDRAAAAGAGLLASLACALLGTAVGTLCNWPVVRSRGRAVPATALAALLVLVVGVSPANAAVTGLVDGSRGGTVTVPLLPLAAAAIAAAVAVAVACACGARRA
ncbi:ABC transporter [Streptomyces sp. B1866]|uniref:ABC transporter n=1 Tax=Streptomyces sp. B1866 TaxID=3075431 RepID=UPI00288DA196|nr:ABC transporter [Streptomyces sp. B1866]MDT3400388.1 ABC transporter [Streptomyces sp. B1866]